MTFCFVTPTHVGDLQRFELLRRSMRHFAPAADHYALVDTEQLRDFEAHFRSEPGLRFISSKDILPAQLEQQRRVMRRWRNPVLLRMARKLSLEPSPLRGWLLQQLLKLHFLAELPNEAAVFLDSDLMFCSRTTAEEFVRQGELVLLETPALTIEDLGFEVSTRVLMGEPRNGVFEHYAYIHQAPRFLRRTGRRLLQELAARNAGASWKDRFVRQQWPSEYHLLGYVARELESYEGYCRAPGTPSDWVYEVRFKGGEEEFQTVLAQCRNEEGRRKFLLVQSNLGLNQQSFYARLGGLIDEVSGATVPAQR